MGGNSCNDGLRGEHSRSSQSTPLLQLSFISTSLISASNICTSIFSHLAFFCGISDEREQTARQSIPDSNRPQHAGAPSCARCSRYYCLSGRAARAPCSRLFDSTTRLWAPASRRERASASVHIFVCAAWTVDVGVALRPRGTTDPCPARTHNHHRAASQAQATIREPLPEAAGGEGQVVQLLLHAGNAGGRRPIDVQPIQQEPLHIQRDRDRPFRRRSAT